MDIGSALIRNLFYPAWMIKDGNRLILNYLNYFNFLDRLNRAQLLERQFQNLKRILVHAYENTTYYRQVFDSANFTPIKLHDPEDIRRLPILTKEILRNNYQDLIAQNVVRHSVLEASTGGSTGMPMKFLRDQQSVFMRKGQELYFDRWMGYRIGHKLALFVAASHFDSIADKMKARIRNATCERMLRFDPHNITDTYMEKFAIVYCRYRPSMIKCFPNSLKTFASFVRRRKLDLPKVRSISCTGENLYAQDRHIFQETFGGEVFEKVGTRESGVIACECHMHKGLHIFTEGVFCEILKEDGTPARAGEIGKLILTDLFNKAMPLIRYELGDMAVAGNDRLCSCGSNLPLFERLLGRDRDILIDSLGNPKPGYLFTECILRMNLTAQFQIIQPDKENLIVRIVTDKHRMDLNLEELRREFEIIMGPSVRIRFEFVGAIERDPSGKYGYVISKLGFARREESK